MTTDDVSLLREYAQSSSEQAFATLVTRHIDLVYSVALRQVRDPHLAEEVTQGVFIILARKAKSLDPKTVLSGWLCRTARYVSCDTLKVQRRRQIREQESQMQSICNEPNSNEWNQIAPLLDEAMNHLGEKEHDAVVLRFFEGKELKHVGAAMGVTEDAARMRVNRAIEKLRRFFAKKGVALSAAAIGGAVSANALQAAPAGLTSTVTASALSGITAAATCAATKAIAMTTLHKALFAAAFVAAVGTAIYEAHRSSAARAEANRIRQQQAPLAQQIQQLAREHDDFARRLAGMPDEAERQRFRKEHLELLSLRGRVKLLANELRQLKEVRAQAEANSHADSEPHNDDSILFSASLTNSVAHGQSLIVGGWSMKGQRGYVLLTPAIRNDGGASELTVQSQVIGAPDNFWNQIGWADAKSEAHRSTVAGVLSSDQLDMLLTALKATAGSELSNTSLARGGNGEYVGIGFTLSDEHGEGVVMGIDVCPRIGADGESVELEIRPSAVSTNTPIYPSLRPTGQPEQVPAKGARN